MSQKVLFVEYCADDMLGGTLQMSPMTELVYRRICDMIYSTQDNLLDNEALKYGTKAGSKWKQIREELITVHKKIYIENGYIRNKKCSEKIAKSRKNIEQKREAGKASAQSRKPLKNNNTGSTAVQTAAITDVSTNQEPKNPSNKKILKKDFEKEFEETFWPVAVKKKSVAAARKAYIAARAKTDMQAIMQSWRTHNADWAEKKGTDDWEFVPYPATWLNAERWCDELEPTTAVRDPNRKTLTDFDSFGEYQEYLKTIGENA